MSEKLHWFPTTQVQNKLHFIREICRERLPLPGLDNILELSFAPSELKLGVLGNVEDCERPEDAYFGTEGGFGGLMAFSGGDTIDFDGEFTKERVGARFGGKGGGRGEGVKGGEEGGMAEGGEGKGEGGGRERRG